MRVWVTDQTDHRADNYARVHALADNQLIRMNMITGMRITLNTHPGHHAVREME